MLRTNARLYLILVCCAVPATGCTSRLDREALLLNEKYRTMVLSFADASDIARESWLKNANEMFKFAEEKVAAKWAKDVLDPHTDDAGSLMMDDGAGKAVPWKRAELETSLFAEKQSLTANLWLIWLERAKANEIDATWKNGIAAVRKATTVYEITDGHVAEAKASLEQAAAAATQFLGTAIGVGGGIILAR